MSCRKTLWDLFRTNLIGATFTDLTHAFHPDQPHFSNFPNEDRKLIYDHAKGDGCQVHHYGLVGQWGNSH